MHGRCTDLTECARMLHGFARMCTDARTLHGRCTDISWCPADERACVSALLLLRQDRRHPAHILGPKGPEAHSTPLTALTNRSLAGSTTTTLAKRVHARVNAKRLSV